MKHYTGFEWELTPAIYSLVWVGTPDGGYFIRLWKPVAWFVRLWRDLKPAVLRRKLRASAK